MGDVAGSLDLSSLGLPGMSFPGFGGLVQDDDDDDDVDYVDDEDDGYDEEIEDAVVQIDAPETLPGKGQLPPGGSAFGSTAPGGTAPSSTGGFPSSHDEG